MLYHYWIRHGILPSVLYNLPVGEKIVLRAFYEHEMEEKHKAIQTGKVFPVIDLIG
jgi:hypothetical protein